ncbi:MAG: methyltransferase domain-containing protein [Acidobacteriia bacterium]|nr:methyltransferase domain-containing protein [Terriglobia bacterium]
MKQPPRFDELSSSYEELLRDPIRDRFTGQESIFFHRRKADLIRRFFRRRGLATAGLRYLDVGCGKGELLQLLQSDFRQSAGCDVSAGMMQEVSQIAGIETRVQKDSLQIPFGDAEFDLITAVCVFHHVPPSDRRTLTSEIKRVLRPGGFFCLIEHNPFNPVTRLIVSRTPVDADAILLRAAEARGLTAEAELAPLEQDYFLYFPQALYRYLGPMETLLSKVPLGGQYALFSGKHR